LIIIRPLHGLNQARLEVREMSRIIIRHLHGLDQARLDNYKAPAWAGPGQA